MKTLLELITIEMREAFVKAGYDEELAKVTLSNRPDLCEYQCNGALAGAKKYKKAPFMIAEDVAAQLKDCPYFEMVDVVKPGFINLKLSSGSTADYLNEMAAEEKLGVEEEKNPKTVIIDYGGPNVAKPLHVGHLRSAIIGESVKRIIRYKGNHVIGDIHLGDWGYQMGLIITELKKRQPDLPYFDENYEGEYPKEAPFTIGELEEIYPTASAYAKEHEDYREEALHATYLLQNGYRGYRAIWEHIMRVSVADLKKNYQNLNVEFDLWKGEADAQKYIPDMVQMLKDEGYARYDEGALVVDDHQGNQVEPDGDVRELLGVLRQPPRRRDLHALAAAGGVLFGEALVDALAGGDVDEHDRVPVPGDQVDRDSLFGGPGLVEHLVAPAVHELGGCLDGAFLNLLCHG